MASDKSGSVFPKEARLREVIGSMSAWNNPANVVPGEQGLTKRELFAAMAQNALLVNLRVINKGSENDVPYGFDKASAYWAVKAADALLKELAKKGAGE